MAEMVAPAVAATLIGHLVVVALLVAQEYRGKVIAVAMAGKVNLLAPAVVAVLVPQVCQVAVVAQAQAALGYSLRLMAQRLTTQAAAVVVQKAERPVLLV
jgi:hypothetical protein